MTTTQPAGDERVTFRQAALPARDGFGQALRAEWTKLRSVRATVVTAVAAVALTVGLSLLAAAGGRTDANDGPHFVDQLHLVHQPLTGDGTITARVRGQQPSHEWAKAGLLITRDTASGAPYAALMVTPGHGVRLQAEFDTELAGSHGGAPRWLRLARAGTAVTGYESADGVTWDKVGTVTVAGLPATARVGLFVTSPASQEAEASPGSTHIVLTATPGEATFDQVSVTPAGAASRTGPAGWSDTDVGAEQAAAEDQDQQPNAGAASPPGGSRWAGGTVTVTGNGDLGGIGIGGIESGDDDVVSNALVGAQIGLIAVVALGVLAATAEYRTGTLHTTFLVSPRRGRVLAAKAVVVGGLVLAVGLVASVGAFLLAQPIQHARGFGPPSYPDRSLADGPVARAVVGTALFLAVLAVFSVAVGVLLRRAAGAITLVIALVTVPQLVTSALSVDATRWVQRVTPIAGLAIQQTRHRFDTAIAPWAGFGVLCGYAALALGLALWALRRTGGSGPRREAAAAARAAAAPRADGPGTDGRRRVTNGAG
ncbi:MULTISPECIES: ABC transporter permease subunit [unclassified Pseudofrankia]|uniref:ABC transporter permease subunit n=1 Tax=unclassified Pseudofrankia TaxID=2994372 RepID=UPI0008D9C287|nr:MULTISPECIES: ABC transporter permease subunit [unclassified Pseudofrankia]MDT3438144.1 ABC transporter permease subunit [Pseudofrankia sp. BMG5.37]OHV56847.1 hypothetical protein BCD48_07285 [Pseudofrankia sp. BMG5.36]